MRKVIDVGVVVSAIIGLILLVGVAGHSDCVPDYPFIYTVKHTFIALMFLIPAVIRSF